MGSAFSLQRPFIVASAISGFWSFNFCHFPPQTKKQPTKIKKKVNELLVVSCGLSLQPLLETGVKSSQSLHLLSYIRVSRKVSC
ncbi:hypothetical protein P8452_53670 [Trifolium repens]|nr:hypothetical protein P8452_53670 [Trifolium repens]